jgi:nucleoside-diphosphate-sugar epimerase
MGSILITGSSGFIGNRTAQLLLEQGNEVIGIDNMNDYYDIRLKQYRLKNLEKFDQFRFYQVDIENIKALEKIFAEHQFDSIINLAARAGVRYSIENPHVYMTTNADGTLNILEMMRKYEIKKMVLASSSSLYAMQPMPFSEDLPGNTPVSPYAASKKAAEVIAYTYHFLFGFDITILRYFTVYGPAGRPDMSVFRFIKWIDEGKPIELNGDGSQSRDFTYVDDIARGTIKALGNKGYEIINLGGGKNPFTLNYMIKKIEEHLGKKALINYKDFHKADVMETWADISKAKELLNWEPVVTFDEGLKRTVDWYLENKSWVNEILLP